MLMCIEPSNLKIKNTVQKELQVYEDFLENTLYCDDLNSANEQGFEPVCLKLIVRSATSNKVLENTRKGNKYYTISNYALDYSPFLYDECVMYQTSLLFNSILSDNSFKVQEAMLNSQFLPLGILCTPAVKYNFVDENQPIILVSIVIKDDVLNVIEESLKPGYSFVDIKDMQMGAELKVIYDEIVEVKEDCNNDSH